MNLRCIQKLIEKTNAVRFQLLQKQVQGSTQTGHHEKTLFRMVKREKNPEMLFLFNI